MRTRQPALGEVELKEREFFAQRSPWIANAPTAAERKKRIKQLLATGEPGDQALYSEFANELRKSGGWTQLLKQSGRYPLTARGRLNTYAVFAEAMRTALASGGRAGIIVPTGIATDATTQYFFSSIAHSSTLASLYDFENARPIFTERPSQLQVLPIDDCRQPVSVSVLDLHSILHDVRDLSRASTAFTLNPTRFDF